MNMRTARGKEFLNWITRHNLKEVRVFLEPEPTPFFRIPYRRITRFVFQTGEQNSIFVSF